MGSRLAWPADEFQHQWVHLRTYLCYLCSKPDGAQVGEALPHPGAWAVTPTSSVSTLRSATARGPGLGAFQ